MTRQELLDLYFVDARSKLIDIAAFLDRVDRGGGGADFRLEAFHRALAELSVDQSHRACRILEALSDPTLDPIPAAASKAASGAWPGKALA